MVIIVDTVKPNIDILNLTKKQDYCVIHDIFSSNNHDERQLRLFQCITLLTNPCASTEEVKNDYSHFQNTFAQLNLKNYTQDDLILKLLPCLEKYYKTSFVIKHNGVTVTDTSADKYKEIFVIFGEDNDGSDDYLIVDDDCVILPSDNVLPTENYYLALVMKTSDFKLNFNESHNHDIDLCCVEFFPLDTFQPGNICQMSTYSFSPVRTLQEIQTNLSLSRINHTDNDFVMKLKKLVRVAKNFGYISKGLDDEFFSDFLSQFYRVFKKEIDTYGYIEFVDGLFKQNLESHCNPKSLSKEQTSQLTIHEQFLYNNYDVLAQFVVTFQNYASFEDNDDIKKTSTTDSLTVKQKANRNLVKKYENKCQDFQMKTLIQNLCIENADLERHNNCLKKNLE